MTDLHGTAAHLSGAVVGADGGGNEQCLSGTENCSTRWSPSVVTSEATVIRGDLLIY